MILNFKGDETIYRNLIQHTAFGQWHFLFGFKAPQKKRKTQAALCPVKQQQKRNGACHAKGQTIQTGDDPLGCISFHRVRMRTGKQAHYRHTMVRLK